MKWRNSREHEKAKSGNLAAYVSKAALSSWLLTVEREWFNSFLMEDKSIVVVRGTFKTKTKAKAAGEALIGIIEGEP